LKKIFIVLLFAAYVYAEDTIPAITTADIAGVQITRSETYNGEGLWGYIDGGADIYLEYGFDKVLVQEIIVNGIKAKADIYMMKSAEAAFGIFSLSRFKCRANPELCTFNCVSEFQVQLARGNFYMSIVNERGSDEERELCLRAAKILVNKVRSEDIETPYAFAFDPQWRVERELKFIAGKLGLENGMPEWTPLFKDIPEFNFYVVPLSETTKLLNAAVIILSGDDAVLMFHKNAGFKKVKPEQEIRIGKISKRITMITPARFIYREWER
jgi:hypothetical protein